MDIGSVEGLSAIQAAITQQQISTTLLSKTLDIANTQAQAAIDLIESAAETIEQGQSSGNRRLDVRI